MKRKLIAFLAAPAAAAAVFIGGALPAQAATPRVSYYSSLSQCSQAADYFSQRGTIVQFCTADVYINGKPSRWRLMYNL
ncbi:hypothetical protein ABIB49_000420 [Arthrobacter sp. UYCu512]|uniref:hypothetical protein n=1 Tax=Arthrobacter sp. UYCu512 TaxID=3156338 RepID=UPI0033964182